MDGLNTNLSYVANIYTDTKLSTRMRPVADGEYSLSRIIYFNNGASVEIPISKNGSVRWYDDSKLTHKAGI